MLTIDNKAKKLSFSFDGNYPSDSVVSGFSDMRLLDIDSQVGICKLQKRLDRSTTAETATTPTFTADADTDVCTASTSLRPTGGYQSYYGLAVTFTTTNTLPAGLSINTIYYLTEVTSATFKVSATYADYKNGTFVNITGAGTGVHSISAIYPKKIKHFRERSGYSQTFAIDEDGRLWIDSQGTGYQWMLLSGNTLPSAGDGGYGLEIWKGYVFVFRNNALDLLSLSAMDADYTLTWSNSWKDNTYIFAASNGNYEHNALVSTNENLYWCNAVDSDGKFQIGSLQEALGNTFVPATGTTYNLNEKALDIPSPARCLVEQGDDYLVIGTKVNHIYYWDRISPSWDKDLILSEYNIIKMIVENNVLYIFPKNSEYVYATNGTNVSRVLKIPDSISNVSIGQPKPQFYGAMVIDGKLYYNVMIRPDGTNYNSLIYCFNPDNDTNVIKHYPTISNVITDIGALGKTVNSSYLLSSWKKTGTPNRSGIDVGTLVPYYETDYAAGLKPYFITELTSIGNNDNKGTIYKICLNFARKMKGTFYFYYRTDINEAWITIGNVSSTIYNNYIEVPTYGKSATVNLSSLINVQFKVEMIATTADDWTTAPFLKSFDIYV